MAPGEHFSPVTPLRDAVSAAMSDNLGADVRRSF
jgi:hypothetical protein